MADIRHRVGIAAPQARVYEALTTTEGLARWWTQRVDGDPDLGGTLRFFFGGTEPGAVMEVVDASAPDRVTWRCAGGPHEWVGTTIDFALRSAEGETVVLFTHGAWREPVDFLHHCSTKWGYFLLGLKAWLEGDKASPYPDDMPISAWG